MLRIAKVSEPIESDGRDLGQIPRFDLKIFLDVARRQWPVILGCVFFLVLCGLGYVLTAQSRYTASALIMIETRKNQLLSQQQVVSDQILDTSGIESQVEVLKSESVALSVIRDLKLTEDPEFLGRRSLAMSIFNTLFGNDEEGTSDYEKERSAVLLFSSSLQVKRIGLTYVIQIDFTSYSAAKAAEIANAIADAYMVNELESRYQATKRASRWLQDRIKELREQASVAESSVQSYRADNNIVDTGRGLLSEQQLADVNTQLVAARAATAEAKAKLDRIDQISTGEIPDATVTDALRNDVIVRLRAQYLDIAAREADWSARFGADHAAAVNLRNQMREIRKSIQNEVQRIAQTYKSDFEIARAREDSLQKSLASLVETAGSTGQAQVKLRDLESTSQSYRNLYDNFLQRFMEATQQQTFPTTEGRLITAATLPLQRSAPRTLLTIAGSSVLGLMLGCAMALTRERLDNVYRVPSQVEADTRMECIGILPRVPLSPDEDRRAFRDGQREEFDSPSITRHALNVPFSRFAETIRGIKVAADLSGLTRQSRVIGVVSALPNEGKTTVSANLAQLIAQSGHKVILIDGDLRNPSLTRSLAPLSPAGLVEVLSGHKSVQEVLRTDPATGLRLLPTILHGRIWHTAELLSSSAMAGLIERARTEFDYVIIDLPPIVPVVDVRAVASLIDGFVMVIEWGKTSRDAVSEALSSAEVLKTRMVGIVLNKASVSVLKRLEGYKGRYYRSYYSERDDLAA